MDNFPVYYLILINQSQPNQPVDQATHLATQDDQQIIRVQGAREHNLKNVSLDIPKFKLVVLTGLSGSGKSSLAFDTLYAEGQRRYVESLSSYARQFLGLMKKPDVDHIDGLSPAISIDQKTTSHNPRSTVGTITEIYDYLRLLFARIGHPTCPNCGQEVSSQSVDQIVNQTMATISQRTKQNGLVRLIILAPIVRDKKGAFEALFERLRKQGYLLLRIDKQVVDLDKDDLTLIKTNRHSIAVILNRLSITKQQLKSDTEIKRLRAELARSIEEATKLADGYVYLTYVTDATLTFPEHPKEMEDILFSEKLACSTCGISLQELEPRLFSFNSPHGACSECNGLGSILKIDQEKILAPSLTLSEGAIIPFTRTMASDTWWSRLVTTVVIDQGYDFRKTVWADFDQATQQLLLYGSPKVYTVAGENRFGTMTSIQEKFEGFVTNLERRYHDTDSEFMRGEIGQFMEKRTCPSCLGTRLNPTALSVFINHKSIADVTAMPVNQAIRFLGDLSSYPKLDSTTQADRKTDDTSNKPSSLSNQQSGNNHNHSILSLKEAVIASSILSEIMARLEFLDSVGLNYLTLDREAATLAGGEAQRIRLASQIGTGLSGVLYILDEPTIGLHQRDNERLIATLKMLRDKGNSVVVVEHDADVIKQADYVFDFGPGAGKGGGQIVAEGTPIEIMANSQSLTGKYLGGKKTVKRLSATAQKEATKSNLWRQFDRHLVSDDEAGLVGKSPQIRIDGAHHHNLKHVDVNFPLRKLTCLTGVSGSGKSTLLHDTLYWQLAKYLGRTLGDRPGAVTRLSVPDEVKRVYLIDQKPIGKTPRSNPATYSKTFDTIRELFANTPDARIRGYKPGRFSFNTKGGRCESCKGDGQIKIEMQFLPDIYVTCDVCGGKRYNEETLSVEYRGRAIDQVLAMTVDEAVLFFQHHSLISRKLATLQEVGLGYLTLGQPAPTLSGGEAQRLKLAKELSQQSLQHTVYLLDEPTTGLHFADVQKLLNVLVRLVSQDNTVIVIEHNLDIIKNADWLIDLGPEGGEGGGEIIFTGTPEDCAQSKESLTGRFLNIPQN